MVTAIYSSHLNLPNNISSIRIVFGRNDGELTVNSVFNINSNSRVKFESSFFPPVCWARIGAIDYYFSPAVPTHSKMCSSFASNHAV